MRKFVLDISIVVSVILVLASADSFAQVLTFNTGDKLYVRWPVVNEAGIEGYHVYRRADNETAWQRQTAGPLKFIRGEQQVREQAGYKAEMFLQLFGAADPPGDITDEIYNGFLEDEEAVSFMELMTLVNPELGYTLGVIYIDSAIIGYSTVQYRITAVIDGNEGEHTISERISLAGGDVIPGIENFSGTPGHQGAQLRWDKHKDEIGSGEIVTYRIYRGDSRRGPFEEVNMYGLLPVTISSGDFVSGENVQEYNDKYLENGKRYYYSVRAVNAFGLTGPSSEVIEVIPVDTRPAGPPDNLRAKLFGTGLLIEWDHDNELLKGFEVYKSNSRDEDFMRVFPRDTLLLENRKSWIDFEVEEGQHHYYYLRSVNQAGMQSRPSDTLHYYYIDKTPPEPPQNLIAIADTGVITIQWNKNNEEDIAGYEVERASDDRFETRFLLTNEIIGDTFYIDSLPAISQTTYGYLVYAIDNSYNRSGPSQMVKAGMPDIAAPQHPVITSLTRKGNVVSIEWTPSIEKDAAGYRIYRSEKSEEDFIPAGETKQNNTTDRLESSGTFIYSITALDNAGNESEKSPALSIDYDEFEKTPAPASGTITRKKNDLVAEWEEVTAPRTAGYLVSRIDPGTGRKLDVAETGKDRLYYVDRVADVDKRWIYHIKTYDTKWRMSAPLVIEYIPDNDN
jgi:fibronectin type 3 domain-containing protein